MQNTNKSELLNHSLIEYKHNTLIVWTKMANFEEQAIKFVNITFSKVVLITCHQARQITFWNRKRWNGIMFPKLSWPSVRKSCSKTELSQVGIFFALNLFAGEILLVEKLEIAKTKTNIISVLKVEH